MGKMDKKWVVLCSTAIAAVYAAGYFATETPVISQQPPHSQVSIQTNGGQTNSDQAQAGASSKTSPTNRLYKDGTYAGMGSNRRGSIQLAVTIKNDKITDVEVSHFAMHYSESDIVGLPDEVLQKQKAQVTNVSGATYSTRAFEDAVQNALSQAKKAQKG